MRAKGAKRAEGSEGGGWRDVKGMKGPKGGANEPDGETFITNLILFCTFPDEYPIMNVCK